jgi:mRNA interferase MazF
MIRRGDIVTVSASGDFGKPRPAVVIQADELSETFIESCIVCLITSKIHDAPLLRIDLKANERTGLTRPSQIMVDKILTLKKERVGSTIGKLNKEEGLRLDRTLAFVIGIG